MKRWKLMLIQLAAALALAAGTVAVSSPASAHDSVQGCEVSQNGNRAHFHCWSPNGWELRRSIWCVHLFFPPLSYQVVHNHTFLNSEGHHNITLSCPSSWITNAPSWRFTV
jgi:hypothetical protein